MGSGGGGEHTVHMHITPPVSLSYARHSSHMLTAHQQIAQQQLAGTQSNPHTSQLEALWHLPSQDRPEGEEATTARGALGHSISFHGNAVAVKSACSTEDLCDLTCLDG